MWNRIFPLFVNFATLMAILAPSAALAEIPSALFGDQAAPVYGPEAIPSAIFDPYSTGWASVRNMTSAGFSQYFDEMERKGYMVIDIEVDEIDGEQRVGAVWQQNIDGRGWAELRNLTDGEFHDKWTELKEAGYRPIDQEGYTLDGRQLYAGVWTQNKENLDWVSYRNATGEEFSELFDRYKEAGYMMIDVDAYPIGDTLYYAAVWVENVEGLAWVEWRNLTDAEFSEKFEEYKEDYRMIDVESYPWNGEQYYAGIWVENPSNRYWAEWRDMTAKEFGDRWLMLRDAGYRLINYEVYPKGGSWRYAGIWRQNGIRPVWQFKDEVDGVVEDYYVDNDIPGMSVAVYHAGQFVYLRGLGFADVDDEVIAHSRTIFRTASIAKGVAGALGVLLSEKGLIDLDEDSSFYIPGLPDHHTHTVAQTLTNRSGIKHYSSDDDCPGYSSLGGDFATDLDVVEEIWDVSLQSTPGTDYCYSTFAYTFAGASMEGAVGGSIEEIFDDHLRNPFNLNTLRPEDRSMPHKFRATLYNTDNDEVEAEELDYKRLGGGLETSAYDLGRFAIQLLNHNILDEAALDLLWTPPDGLANYAYGWDTGTQFGTQVIGKAGAQNGARSYIRIYPEEDLVILVLSNRRDHDTRQLCIDIAAEILAGGSQNAPVLAGLDSPLAAQAGEVEEPEDEGQDPAEVIWPQENPVATPSPQDLADDDSAPVNWPDIYLPFVKR